MNLLLKGILIKTRWNKSFQAKEINLQVYVPMPLLMIGKSDNFYPGIIGAGMGGGPIILTHIENKICKPTGFYYRVNKLFGYNVRRQEIYFIKAWRILFG